MCVEEAVVIENWNRFFVRNDERKRFRDLSNDLQALLLAVFLREYVFLRRRQPRQARRGCSTGPRVKT